jgi:hypothetical protein
VSKTAAIRRTGGIRKERGVILDFGRFFMVGVVNP